MIFEPYTFVPVEKRIDKEGNTYFKNFDIHAKVTKTEIQDDEIIHILLQDILGQKFEAKIPHSKFEGADDYAHPFEPLNILKVGHFVRLRGAKISDKLNLWNETKDKLLPTVSELNPALKEVFYLDFESKWGASCSIMVIPAFYKISEMLASRVIEDELVLRLIKEKSDYDEVLRYPRVISRISKFYDNFEINSLESIYYGENSKSS